MSSRLQLVFASSFLCMSVVACGSLFAKKDDAGAPDAAVVSGSGIANEADITRYGDDEQPASDEVKTLKSAVVHATFPGTDIVATLSPDTTVTELATHAGGVLIIFEQAGSKKMGWVDAAVVPEIAAAVEDAAAPKVVVNNNTVVVHRDAGAAKVVDAGAPPPAKVVDAGAPKPGKVADAGAPAGSTKQVLKDMPASGKCDSGYYEYPKGEKKCRLICKADTECGGTLKCRDMNGQKICYR